MKHTINLPKTILKIARNYFLKKYPGLEINRAYWRMLEFLLHPHQLDEENGWYLGHDVIDCITRDTTINAIDFLLDFKRDVLPGFTWSEPTQGKARTVTTTGLDDLDYDFFLQARDMKGKRKGQEGYQRVYIVDGTQFSRSKQRDYEKKADAFMRQQAEDTYSETQKLILSYHVNLPRKTFSALIEANKDKAYDFIEGRNKPEDRMKLYRQLDQIIQNPKPRYQITSNKTLRLYPFHGCANLTSIKREIRQALTPGCYEIDLWACHLAIISKDWDIPELRELMEDLLQKNVKPWAYFAGELGLLLTDDLKAAMKKAVYTLCYGGWETTIKKPLNKFQRGLGKKFLTLPIMRTILDERKRVKEERRFIFGSFERDNMIECELIGDRTDAEIRSLISCDAQAIEQKLIGSIYQVAIKHRSDFTILVYSFDGVTIKINKNKKTVLRLLKRAVDDLAVQLGIPTTIDNEKITGEREKKTRND